MPNIKRKPKNIEPRDENGKEHGESIVYHDNGRLWYRWNYVHGIKNGLQELYYSDGEVGWRGYFNMGEKIGYWRYDNKKQYYLCLT